MQVTTVGTKTDTKDRHKRQTQKMQVTTVDTKDRGCVVAVTTA
jgi:hypothetical protein